MRRSIASRLMFGFKLTLGILCVLIVSAAIYVLAFANHNSRKTVSPPIPRTDQAPLKKRFPFLGSFEQCLWITGVAYDGSKGLVPGPSEYFIQAYVMLDPKQTKELLNQYEWTESKSDDIPRANFSSWRGFPSLPMDPRGGPMP